MIIPYLKRLFPLTVNFFKLTKMGFIKERIVWVDCEMTGLDVNKHRLVELACIITEPDLQVYNV